MSDIEQRIRARAYQLWEQAGRPDEDSGAFWLAAEREIEGGTPPLGDRPAGAIDAPVSDSMLEEPPEAAAQRGEPVGMPGERIAEAGVADERLAELAAPASRPSEPEATEAAVPASRQPTRSVSNQPARKAAKGDTAPTSGRGKPAPRQGGRR